MRHKKCISDTPKPNHLLHQRHLMLFLSLSLFHSPCICSIPAQSSEHAIIRLIAISFRVLTRARVLVSLLHVYEFVSIDAPYASTFTFTHFPFLSFLAMHACICYILSLLFFLLTDESISDSMANKFIHSDDSKSIHYTLTARPLSKVHSLSFSVSLCPTLLLTSCVFSFTSCNGFFLSSLIVVCVCCVCVHFSHSNFTSEHTASQSACA